MKLISTHDVNLKFHKSITVLEENGQVVVSGRRKDESEVILLLTLEGGQLREKEIKSPCTHKYLGVLSIRVKGTEYLGILCSCCKDIKLLNLRTGEIMSAFSGEDLIQFCHGEHNRLFVTASRLKGEMSGIIELDCSEIPLKRLAWLYKMGAYKLCYVPSPYKMLLTGNRYQTEAISYEKNEIIWNLALFLKNDENVINHQGAAFSARHSTVLVCDCSSKSRLLILDPRNGSHLQTICRHSRSVSNGFLHYTRFLGFLEFSGYHQWQQESQ